MSASSSELSVLAPPPTPTTADPHGRNTASDRKTYLDRAKQRASETLECVHRSWRHKDFLAHLPTDILLRITRHLYGQQALTVRNRDMEARRGPFASGELCQLLLTCKRLHRVVTPSFYGQVLFWLDSPSALDIFTAIKTPTDRTRLGLVKTVALGNLQLHPMLEARLKNLPSLEYAARGLVDVDEAYEADTDGEGNENRSGGAL